MATKVLMSWGFNDVGPYRPGMGEVHIYLPAITTVKDDALHAACVELMDARTQLMGSNVTAAMYRVSVVGQPKNSFTTWATPSATGGSPLLQAASVSQGTCDLPGAALVASLSSQDGKNKSKIYMSGLPDNLLQTGVPVGPNFAGRGLKGYQALFQTWQGFLLNGNWGFRCLQQPAPPQPVPIAYFLQNPNPPGNLDMVLYDAGGFSPAVGAIVHVRKVLMGVSGVLKPLGRWRVLSTRTIDSLTTAYELANSSSFSAVLVLEPGTVESVNYQYLAYNSVDSLMQGKRARGIGPVRPRGRQRSRARRQPS